MHADGGLKIRLGLFQSRVDRVAGRGGGRADRGREGRPNGSDRPQSSEFHRLGSGVGEGNRTPDLQNHNLAL